MLLKFMQIRTILYQYIKTLIKHVFLLNFTYELFMSFRKTLTNAVQIKILLYIQLFQFLFDSSSSFDFLDLC